MKRHVIWMVLASALTGFSQSLVTGPSSGVTVSNATGKVISPSGFWSSNAPEIAAAAAFGGGLVQTSRTLTAISPITGGGGLDADRSIGFDGTAMFNLPGATNIPASAIASGTLSDARLSGNVSLLGNQIALGSESDQNAGGLTNFPTGTLLVTNPASPPIAATAWLSASAPSASTDALTVIGSRFLAYDATNLYIGAADIGGSGTNWVRLPWSGW